MKKEEKKKETLLMQKSLKRKRTEVKLTYIERIRYNKKQTIPFKQDWICEKNERPNDIKNGNRRRANV